MDFNVDLFVYPLQRLFHLFAVGFATTDKVLEEDDIVDDLDVKREECAIVANADAIDTFVADKMFAVGDVFYVVGLLDFLDYAAYGLEHFTGKFAHGFFKTF